MRQARLWGSLMCPLLAQHLQSTLLVFTCPWPSPTALILPKIGSTKQFLRGRNDEIGVRHAHGGQGGTT